MIRKARCVFNGLQDSDIVEWLAIKARLFLSIYGLIAAPRTLQFSTYSLDHILDGDMANSMADDKLVAETSVQDKPTSSVDSGIADGYDSIQEGTLKKVTKISSIITVLVSGLALFSDGYNAQIIGYMKPLFDELYTRGYSDSISTRLSNSYLIGEIFGMLFFGA
jgi:hypothetical protein